MPIHDNTIASLQFEELNFKQLMLVISEYCDTNRYPTFKFKEKENTLDLVSFFEQNYHSVVVLRDYFNTWTKNDEDFVKDLDRTEIIHLFNLQQ